MRTLASILAGLALAAAAAGAAQAQGRLTEQFIPIGESPGVSGESAVIGVVTAVDETRGVVTVEVAGAPKTFVLTPGTHVWLDRSDEGAAALEVGQSGVRVGDRVEIAPGEPAAAPASAGAGETPMAAWIKIDQTGR